MRITHISDTHNKHNQLQGKLPGGVLLIHSGDISSIGRKHEVEKFIEWFSKQPYMYKVFIAGNHDISFQDEKQMKRKEAYFGRRMYNDEGESGKPTWLRNILNNLPDGVFYLENNMVKLEGINIWGSPYSPTFGYEWAFNADRGYDINCIWEKIPNEVDIVITHTPIYGYCDRAANTNQNVGCADLYHKLLEVEPHLHFCGHIHEGYGYKEIQYKRNWGAIYTFNGCTCDLSYDPINEPITFNYDFLTRELNFL